MRNSTFRAIVLGVLCVVPVVAQARPVTFHDFLLSDEGWDPSLRDVAGWRGLQFNVLGIEKSEGKNRGWGFGLIISQPPAFPDSLGGVFGGFSGFAGENAGGQASDAPALAGQNASALGGQNGLNLGATRGRSNAGTTLNNHSAGAGNATQVPESSTFMLLGSGLLALLVTRRRLALL